ncbi:hypothetical protein [Brucella intermedia]|uniref:hypothetical protein n=1 Tax=Brucella intermedia TaxID=94625 RepID=UPI0009891E92|nr:hypothetical protein [Brucella intermedia]OOC60094.1 hypothetical protein AS855_16155 [Brucella intermedia M86]
MLDALPPPPVGHHKSNDMWIDEQIWGHRLWDATNPWLIFLEFLGVAEAKDREGTLLDHQGKLYPLDFRPAQRMYLRNILYNNEHLTRVAAKGLADGAAWSEWLTWIDENAQGIHRRDFSYLKKRFNSFKDFAALVSMIRGTTIENTINKRWSSRFVFPFGRHALYEDVNVKNNSPSREYINFGLPGELLYQMLSRASVASDLALELAKGFDGDRCDRLLSLLEPPEDEVRQHRGNSFLPYAQHESFEQLGQDWLTLLQSPQPRFDIYPHLATLATLHLMRYQLSVGAEICELDRPTFICEIVASRRTPVRELSIGSFQRNDGTPARTILAYLDRIAASAEWGEALNSDTPFLDCRRVLKHVIRWPDTDDYSGPEDPSEMLAAAKKAALARHRQHVAQVHRSYGSGAGLVSRRGTTQLRYAPNDALLKTLIFANVGVRMEFAEFLRLLFERYGMVIGDREAALVLSEDEYDRKSFQNNATRLERRLRTLGMLRRLSDACAYVENPLFSKVRDRV